ncbi:hypothetical protein CRUP_003901 [Coryphaenoides rupestris]|nr:hypothetical protein CRUP_003901 [Coryphaenoides rupestris]
MVRNLLQAAEHPADYLTKHQEKDLKDMLNSLYDMPRNLTEYFVAVDVSNMLQLYASLLHERRIIVTSSKLSTFFSM